MEIFQTFGAVYQLMFRLSLKHLAIGEAAHYIHGIV